MKELGKQVGVTSEYAFPPPILQLSRECCNDRSAVIMARVARQRFSPALFGPAPQNNSIAKLVGGAAKDSQATVYQKHRSLLNSQEDV